MRVHEVIRRPMITEKSSEQREEKSIVAFEVARKATKTDVKRAIETWYGVKVAEVRVANMHGKTRRQGRYVGRRPDWKKAYVRLAPGQSIDVFQNK